MMLDTGNEEMFKNKNEDNENKDVEMLNQEMPKDIQ